MTPHNSAALLFVRASFLSADQIMDVSSLHCSRHFSSTPCIPLVEPFLLTIQYQFVQLPFSPIVSDMYLSQNAAMAFIAFAALPFAGAQVSTPCQPLTGKSGFTWIW